MSAIPAWTSVRGPGQLVKTKVATAATWEEGVDHLNAYNPICEGLLIDTSNVALMGAINALNDSLNTEMTGVEGDTVPNAM